MGTIAVLTIIIVLFEKLYLNKSSKKPCRKVDDSLENKKVPNDFL